MAPASLPPHTVASFDEDLQQLRTTITRMGTLAAAQVLRATDALLRMNSIAAGEVVAGDIEIDALQVVTERAVLEAIARNAPLAEDLRNMLATLHIATSLERVGDYAKNIAKHVERCAALPQHGPAEKLAVLGERALALFQDAMAAFVERDAAKAAAVIRGDDSVDAEYQHAFFALLATAEATAALVPATVHLQAIAKNFERIADQATNIAEQIEFATHGSIRLDRQSPTVS